MASLTERRIVSAGHLRGDAPSAEVASICGRLSRAGVLHQAHGRHGGAGLPFPAAGDDHAGDGDHVDEHRWSTVCIRSIFASGGARFEGICGGRQSDR